MNGHLQQQDRRRRAASRRAKSSSTRISPGAMRKSSNTQRHALDLFAVAQRQHLGAARNRHRTVRWLLCRGASQSCSKRSSQSHHPPVTIQVGVQIEPALQAEIPHLARPGEIAQVSPVRLRSSMLWPKARAKPVTSNRDGRHPPGIGGDARSRSAHALDAEIEAPQRIRARLPAYASPKIAGSMPRRTSERPETRSRPVPRWRTRPAGAARPRSTCGCCPRSAREPGPDSGTRSAVSMRRT